MNKVLLVDISNGINSKAEELTLPGTIQKKLIGGRGLGAYLLYSLTKGKEDPLGSNNPLIFCVGPFQKVRVPYNAKAVLTTKSPLTNGYLYSICGGTFGIKLASLGYISLIIKGKSPEKIYILITPEGVQVKSAAHLWGRETLDTYNLLKEEVKEQPMSAAVIGPTGEKLVRYSGIFVDGERFRAFARGGSGCVMGSKNLKAIALAGKKVIKTIEPAELKRCKDTIRNKIKANKTWATNWIKYGTGNSVEIVSNLNMLPTNNFTKSSFDTAYKLDASFSENKWIRKNKSCGPNCPTPCATEWHINSGDYQGVIADGSEYETLYAFGSNCGIDRLDAILAAQQICDQAGLDTISAGLSIAFAIECFQKGLINKKQTDGLDLSFGDHKAVLNLLRKIVNREGLGDLLAEGVERASLAIPGSDDYAMHVKGLELGGYFSKQLAGQAIEFALNPRGGCHHGLGLIARYERMHTEGEQIEGKGELVKKMAINRVLYDCGIICSFPDFVDIINFDIVASLIKAVTAEDYQDQELRDSVLTIIDLERYFNLREGFKREDDYLPNRLLKGAEQNGFVMEDLLNEGYKAFNWNTATGFPDRNPLKYFEG